MSRSRSLLPVSICVIAILLAKAVSTLMGLFRPKGARGCLTVGIATAVLVLHSGSVRADSTLQVTSGDWSAAGSWNGGVPNSGSFVYINNGGTASITSAGACQYLGLGQTSSTQSGTVQMYGGSSLSAGSGGETLGVNGTGTFLQFGGINTVTGGNLFLGGASSTSNGTYNLNSGQLTVTIGEYVGDAGIGNFTQSGGNNTFGSSFSGGLYIGYAYANSSGTYSLSSGQLSGAFADNEYVGYTGTGTFLQTGGSNTTSSGNLYIGYGFAGSGSGNYTLSGNGYLYSAEYVGYSGTGSFTQNGGINKGSVYLGYNSTGSGTYNLNSGLLMANVTVGWAGAGTFTQSGGTINTFSRLAVDNGTYNLNSGLISGGGAMLMLGGSGTGTFAQSGGTCTDCEVYIGLGGSSGGPGVYNLSGGQLNAGVGQNEYVGYSTSRTFIQSGGVNSAVQLSLGMGAVGVVLQSGGITNATSLYIYNGSTYSLSSTGQLSTTGEYVGGPGTFTQTGGTNAVGSSGLVVGYSAGATGTYNLKGGLLVLSSLSQGSGTAAFNFSGGTMQASSGFSTSLPMTLGTSGGGATFDTAGSTVTLGGTLSGSGGLTKLNSGTLVLAATNNYTGNTTVTGGALIVATGASLGNTSINVGTGATFAPNPGSGTIVAGSSGSGSGRATLTLNSGATFDMTDGNIGVFSLSQQSGFTGTALTIANATLNFDLNGSGADTLAVTKGTAAVSGTNTINITGLGSSLTPGGAYTIISAPSGVSGNFVFSNSSTAEAINVGGTPYMLALNSSGTAETLHVYGPTSYQLATTIANGTIITGGSTTVTSVIQNSGTWGNLLGSSGTALVASGGTTSYTAAGFDNVTVGTNKVLPASLRAGDEQVLNGALGLTTLTNSVTYTVLGHSNPGLTVVSGNGQTVITGGTLASVTLNLTDNGVNLSPLDVNTLNNLSGSTGTAVIGSGGSGSYAATAFDSTGVGLNKTLIVGLKAGDQQALSGASGLTTLSSSVTYSVLAHSNAALSVAIGNAQTIISGGTLAPVTLNLTNSGTNLSPLDVKTLSNLAGSSGTGIVVSGGSATYTAIGFDTTGVGLNKTLVASLKAGDQQALSGASGLTTLSGSVTYGVLGHSDPVLSVASGNNQTIITGGTVAAVTFSVTDSGTNISPLDVNTLNNLSGSSGTAVVAGGGSASYNAGGFDTTGFGLNKALTVSLKAGDEQALSGASGLTTLSSSATYTVLDHSNASLSSGSNQTTQTITFGNVLKGAAVPSQTFTIYNRAANTTAALTANMKLTGSTTSGDPAFTTNVSAFGALAAGSGSTCTASLNTSNYSTSGTATVSMAASQLVDDSTYSGVGNNNNGGLTVVLQGNVGNATAGASNSQTAFGPALTAPVAQNGSYANLESTVKSTTGSGGQGMVGSMASILAGTNSTASAQTVSMAWRTQTYSEGTRLASDVLDLSGMALNGSGGQTSPFVLQMDYATDLLGGDEAILATDEMIHLDWLNSNTNQWENAIDGNVGTNSNHFYLGAWPTGDMTLGDWGVNTANHTAWAMLDHNSQYAVTPEPGTLALLGAGAIVLAIYGWRRRR